MRAQLLALLSLAISACGGGGGVPTPDAPASAPDAPTSTTCTADQLAALEQDMATALDVAAEDSTITVDPDVTVMFETADGRTFTHSHGSSTPTTRYESASTSKWVTAVIVLDLVDQGLLALDTRPHDLLPYWDDTAVDLRDLLSFTSGFADAPACLDLGGANFALCVRAIYDQDVATAAAPGAEYEYSPTHLQIAAAMAMVAASKTSWGQVFDAWRARTGLFPTAAYDLPSATNPRVAGGMHWTGAEYLGFLRALYHGDLLAPDTTAQLYADQRGTATVVYSPVWDAIGEDWSYGLGNWVECPTATTLGGFDCTGLHRNSSAGAYGAYPFVDFDHHYFGLVARQGTLMSAREGIAIYRAVEATAARWADRSCD